MLVLQQSSLSDAPKVDLKQPSNGPPYGIPSGCHFD